MVLVAADYISADNGWDQFFTVDAKLPKTFRISPAKASVYMPFKVLHNPAEDIYVAFIWELDYKNQRAVIHSRAYNNKGKPKGPFYQIAPITYYVLDHAPDPYVIMYTDVCYNSTENKFFLIYTYQYYDGIYGLELNERGNREGVTTWTYSMKKRMDKYGSGAYPRIVWMPENNQYAMGWLYFDFTSSSSVNPKNGYQLATFTPYLTPKKTMKKVRSLRTGNEPYPLTTFIVAGSKLLWGTVEGIDDNWLQPVVWMTKSNGKNLTPEPLVDSGVKYPAKKMKYGGEIYAAYNPDEDLFLLTWNSYDASWEENRTYQENYYRIMDGKGNFIGKQKLLPGVENFQSQAGVTYDQNDGHFLITCAEYKVLADAGLPSPIPQQDSKYFWGGKFWGYQIDMQGEQIGSSIPLSKVFTSDGLYYIGASYNASDDQHILYYYRVDYLAQKSKAFALLYQ